MNPNLSEAQFQDMIITRAKLRGWFVYHNPDSRRSTAGMPDLVLIHPRRPSILYREVKKAGGRVSAAQTDVMDLIADAGGDVRVWRPDDWPAIVNLLDNPIDRCSVV